MNKFGVVKSKLLTKLTESYSKNDKSEVKELLKLIKENKAFKEMYLFYEEIENKYFEDKEIAKLYVEGLNTYFGQPMGNLNDLNVFCESLHNKLSEVEIETNELYESLDTLSEKDSLMNIERKITAKKNLIDYLTRKKENKDINKEIYSVNEGLLNSVLTNNFNVLYGNTLSEEEKNNLKVILSLSSDDIVTKSIELKESIVSKIETLINESNDNELKSKLNKVREEVETKELSRINYFRLTELKNGLN